MNVAVEIIRSDGEKLLIDGTNWKIPSNGLSGFGTAENDLTVIDNAIGDGSVLSSSRVPKKDRTIKFVNINKNLNSILRKVACSFFNPKKTYDVYLTYQGVTRWASGSLNKFSCPTANIYKNLEVTVTFLFTNPYLKSVENFGENIASVSPMAGFPYLSRINYGSPTGAFNFARKVILENDGDVETFCQAIFVAKGTVTNPKLIINGKYVRVLDTMVDGDVITIDFAKSPPTVDKNGVNAIGKTDRTSSFEGMELGIGDTEISYDADNGTSLLEVSIYYNKLYASM